MATKPTHRVKVLTNEKDGKKFYTTVGAAWETEHENETYINIKLDFPVGATELTIFPATEKPESND